jgi:hypothetical protein
MATFAAPMPIMAIRIVEISFDTTLSALVSPASRTVADPCWSSCQTGISIVLRNSSSTRKQRG